MHTYKTQHCQDEKKKDWHNKQQTPSMQYVQALQQRQLNSGKDRKEDPTPRKLCRPTQNHIAQLQEIDTSNIKNNLER